MISLTQGQFNSDVKDKRIKALRPYENSIELLLESGDILVFTKTREPETFSMTYEGPLDVRLISRTEEWTFS